MKSRTAAHINTKTEDTKNEFMCIEMTDASRNDALNAGLDALAEMIEKELGGKVTRHILSKDNPEIEPGR